MSRTYRLSNGNDVSLLDLCRLEPEWAASRVRLLERYEPVIEAAKAADGPITLMLYRKTTLNDEERRLVEDFIGKLRALREVEDE